MFSLIILIKSSHLALCYTTLCYVIPYMYLHMFRRLLVSLVGRSFSSVFLLLLVVFIFLKSNTHVILVYAILS